MITEIFDANGNKVGSMGTCARCGASIKHVVYFEGKTYGTKCIEAVTGMDREDFVIRSGSLDLDATREAYVNRIAAIEERKVNARLEREAWKANQEANAERFREVLEVLDSKTGSGFCQSIAADIRQATSKLDRLEDLLPFRALTIVAEIYAKTTGGRKNSRKYDEAYDYFFDTFTNIEDED